MAENVVFLRVLHSLFLLKTVVLWKLNCIKVYKEDKRSYNDISINPKTQIRKAYQPND